MCFGSAQLVKRKWGPLGVTSPLNRSRIPDRRTAGVEDYQTQDLPLSVEL